MTKIFGVFLFVLGTIMFFDGVMELIFVPQRDGRKRFIH